DGIRLRQIGQSIIEILGGKKIHPAWAVPGGVNKPLVADERDKILAMLPEALEIAQRTLHWYKRASGEFNEEARFFANFPTLFMGLVTDDGGLELYDGHLRVVDAMGNIVVDKFPPEKYQELIG